MSKTEFLEFGIALETFARCFLCKMCFVKVSVPKETEVKSTIPLKQKCIDILGSLNSPSVHGFRYALMTVDEYSKFKLKKLLCTKGEVLEKFKEFIAEHGIAKVLRSDKCKEFTREHFKLYCLGNKTKKRAYSA